nr:hypothetical protein BaRGS_028787 [Batillaria attramentaria]
MFSLALIRFVNHITEKGQNKAFAQPVHRIAQESLEDGPESEAAREEGRALRQLEGIISGQRRNCLLACLAEAGHLLTTEDQLQTYKIDQKGDPQTIPTETQKKLEELERIYQGRTKTSSPEENSGEKMDTGEEAESGKVFSVADVKDVQPAVESDEDADDIWQICTEPVDWERVAWGLVPGHTLAETCLDCGSEEQDEEIMLEDEGARSWRGADLDRNTIFPFDE